MIIQGHLTRGRGWNPCSYWAQPERKRFVVLGEKSGLRFGGSGLQESSSDFGVLVQSLLRHLFLLVVAENVRVKPFDLVAEEWQDGLGAE